MVYESAFTTRRSYSTRPVVSSYSVSYPVSRTVTGSSRVYSTSYPIYSYSPRVTTKRVITSPVRTIYSTPIVRTRVITSPIRTTTTRVYSSPVRTTVYSSPSIHSEYIAPYTSSYSSSSYSSVLPYSSYSYSPSIRTRVVETPVRVIRSSRLIRSSLSPERIITSPIRTLPSILNKELDRIAHRTRPGYGYHALTNYLNSEPFINFESETKRIRNSTNNLMRELHTPVTRRSRSVTPFPAYTYEPASKQALDAYVARVTNPTRHLAKEVHNITQYPDTPRKSKYVGKSHLASVRILGDKAYNTRSALYNPDKVRTDINLLSRYIQNKRGRSEASDRVVVSNEVEGAVEA
ncbi:uncharacterized protein CG45076-like isoform X6 [Episyrphus balteatus]|uniref:uncharacterized protein CG45076-like isoform X6 n=1 Tax=Episyrphus balteatus TaxID=286459 RepID=UPI002486594C|nr:uncharacterized protein CG45076-like isoform X6 [Episyrphus balteatus]